VSRHALVTGSRGFVGSWLTRYLAASGYQVTGLARSSDAAAGSHAPGETVLADIVDAASVQHAVQAAAPDVVFHLAALSDPASGDVRQYYRVNVEGTVNVLEAARTVDARVVVVSSGYVYGRRRTPATEDAATRPPNHYAASKAAMEHATLAAARQGLHAVIARPFNHTGPGQSESFLLPSLVRQAVGLAGGSGDAELQLGNLTPVRDFLDVRDVVAAYEILAREGRPGRAYNVCSGHGRTVQELAELVLECAGVQARVVSVGERRRAADTDFLVGSNARIQAETAWRPRISLAETIGAMLQHARSQASPHAEH
jgi:GDP-4-dehydro-6-deoxy-D-mannose reductase